MSTNKTLNYNLHSWEETDFFLRVEINENFTILDMELKRVEDNHSQRLTNVETNKAEKTDVYTKTETNTELAKKFDKTGGAINGTISFPIDKWATNGSPAIDLNNGDITGANAIILKDAAQSWAEGVLFPKGTITDYSDATQFETLRIYEGVLYAPNPFHAGSTSITLTDTSAASKRVYFPTAYSGGVAPRVIATPYHNSPGLINVSIFNVTSTYFDLYASKTSAGTGSVTILWNSQPSTGS